MSIVVNLAGLVLIAINLMAWRFWRWLRVGASSMEFTTLSVVSSGSRLWLFKAREESR